MKEYYVIEKTTCECCKGTGIISVKIPPYMVLGEKPCIICGGTGYIEKLVSLKDALADLNTGTCRCR